MKTMAPKVRFLVHLFLVVACASLGFSGSGPATMAWIGTWAASQQVPEAQNALKSEDLHDATMRQIVHLSVGGERLRVHMSNVFGTMPLHLTSVHIARPLSPAAADIGVASDKALTFSGRTDVVIPAGAEYISDPTEYAVAPLSDLAVSLHIDSPPEQQTGHPGSRATSYLAHGDVVAAASLPDAKKVEHWCWIAGVDVNAVKDSAAIVVLGDSITDGHGATTNGNDRWTDVLARRLQGSRKTKSLSVLNQGIGGNHLLTDGLGPSALARLDRDVIAQTGVRYLIVLEGVNDIGKLSREAEVSQAEHELLVQQIIGAYGQIIARAHARGIRIFGATILPFGGSEYYHPASANEADRIAVNQWIREPGHFDGMIDFDKVAADPAHPDRLLPAYDCGDHLHPSPRGYQAMGEAVPVKWLVH